MKNSITFVVFDRVGKNGFPGMAVSSLTHTVMPYAWHIAYGVTPVRHDTPIDISHQVFWNLDGFMEGTTKTIAEHMLHLPHSGLRLGIDEHNVPTGDILGNKMNTTYDFWSRPKSIGSVLGKTSAEGLDNTFLISRSQPWSKDHSPAATLESDESGIKLDLYTDKEALHVLTWNEEDGIPTLDFLFSLHLFFLKSILHDFLFERQTS